MRGACMCTGEVACESVAHQILHLSKLTVCCQSNFAATSVGCIVSLLETMLCQALAWTDQSMRGTHDATSGAV
jgi:hypothetical protein